MTRTFTARRVVALAAAAVLGSLALTPDAAAAKKPVLPAQLAGKAGCVSLAGGGCAKGRALDGAGDVLTSPDGRNVYVASSLSGVIAVFRRNPSTGALAQLGGAKGCVGTVPGCGPGRLLGDVFELAVAPDGRSLYALSSGGVAVFARDPATGRLTQPGGSAGCVAVGGAEECATARGLVERATGLALTPDGRTLLVTAAARNPGGPELGSVALVLGFTTDGAGGALVQRAGQAGCIAAPAEFGCGSPAGYSCCSTLSNPVVLADGRVVLNSFLGPSFDVLQAADLGFVYSSPFGFGLGIGTLAASPAGDVVGTVGQGGAITVVSLAGDPARVACLAATAFASCGAWRFLPNASFRPSELAYTADGKRAVVASDGLGLLTRSPSEALTPLACLAPKKRDGCRGARASLAGAGQVALSPDGKFAYATSATADAVSVVRLR